MPLTRDFRKTVRERLARDPGFREALLEEGVTCMLAGEVDVGLSLLRDNRISGTRRNDPQVSQEPDADVGAARQPAGTQPVRDHPLPAGARGSAFGGPGSALTGCSAMDLRSNGGAGFASSCGIRGQPSDVRTSPWTWTCVDYHRTKRNADHGHAESLPSGRDTARQSRGGEPVGDRGGVSARLHPAGAVAAAERQGRDVASDGPGADRQHAPPPR